MNLFIIYLNKIKKTLLKNSKNININLKNDLNNIIVESPPDKFDFDFSSNVAMVLAKKNNLNPRNFSEQIKDLLKNEIKDFADIAVAGPGFLNFKLSTKTWIKIIQNIYKTKKRFGSNRDNKRINIEDSLMDLMYKVPDQKDLYKVVINKDVIAKKTDPILIYSNKVNSQKLMTNNS